MTAHSRLVFIRSLRTGSRNAQSKAATQGRNCLNQLDLDQL